MAIYHLSVKVVQRSKGRSATAAAAYRAGEKIVDDRTGETHDYTRKSRVDKTFLVGWDGTRSELWNAAEQAEKRKDATTAREYEVALPRELNLAENEALARDFAEWLQCRHGCAVDVALHGLKTNNPHMHVLTTTRPSDGAHLGDMKIDREWSDAKRAKHGLPPRKEDLKETRLMWELMANDALRASASEARVDHRSLKNQGVNRAPEIHLGPSATEAREKGKSIPRVDRWAKIRQVNQVYTQALDSIKQNMMEILNGCRERAAEALAHCRGFAGDSRRIGQYRAARIWERDEAALSGRNRHDPRR